MNLYKKINTSLKFFSMSFLIFLISMPVQSAKYSGSSDDFKGFGDEEYNSLIQSKPQQSAQQLKKDYLVVLQLIQNKELVKAKVKVNSLMRQSPNQSLYLNLKALLQLLDKDVVAAETSFLKAISLNQNNIQAYIGVAKIALNNKQYGKAKGYADKVLEKNAYSIKAYKIIADVVMQQNGIDEVESFLLTSQVKVKDNQNAELGIIKLLGKVYASKRQPKRILQLATDYIEKYPDDQNAMSFFALAQITNKNVLAAEKTLRQIIKQQPTDVKHRMLLVRLLEKQKNKDSEMIALLDAAANNQENPALVLGYKTAILIKQKKYQQAETVAQSVEERNPTFSIGKILLADVHLANQKYEDALQYYLKAYEISPNIKLLDGILNVYSKLHDLNSSITFLENELIDNDKKAAIKFRLATAYQQLKKYEKSVKYYEELLAEKKDNVVVLNNLAWIYTEQGNLKAIKFAEKAYQYAPKSGTVADTYGYTLLRLGDKKKALEVLKQAIILDPVLEAIQLHLAEAYIANEYYPEAKQLLEKLITKESAIMHKASRLLEML